MKEQTLEELLRERIKKRDMFINALKRKVKKYLSNQSYWMNRYDKLWRKYRILVVKEHENSITIQQQGAQLDRQNEMISNLLKQRRENNWLHNAVDNEVESTQNAI